MSKRKTKPREVPLRTTLKFNFEKISARLRLVDLEELLTQVFDAIAGAQSMAGSMEPDECDVQRAELDQLRETLTFIFGVAPSKEK